MGTEEDSRLLSAITEQGLYQEEQRPFPSGNICKFSKIDLKCPTK